jgi:coenzyme Q-binding protein COQ10
MHRIHKEKLLPNSPTQVFDLILDVESYPEFVPWCESTIITSQTDQEIIAKMKINYKGFTESYTSRITTKKIDKNLSVEVKAIDGPFKFLNNYWTITEEDGGCKVDFQIDLEFKSFILDKMMGLFFTNAADKMMEAFERRAKELFKQN